MEVEGEFPSLKDKCMRCRVHPFAQMEMPHQGRHFYNDEDIQKYCLDKSKVKEAIHKVACKRYCPMCGMVLGDNDHYCEECKESISISDSFPQQAYEMLMKELNLND
jgi:hypothetical protein